MARLASIFLSCGGSTKNDANSGKIKCVGLGPAGLKLGNGKAKDWYLTLPRSHNI